MALTTEEKRGLRQSQKLLYSSQQFPLVGGGKRRQPQRMSGAKLALVAGGALLLLVVGLIALVTSLAS